jgi:hypothetical protein
MPWKSDFEGNLIRNYHSSVRCKSMTRQFPLAEYSPKSQIIKILSCIAYLEVDVAKLWITTVNGHSAHLHVRSRLVVITSPII